jgi:hypothetical protein
MQKMSKMLITDMSKKLEVPHLCEVELKWVISRQTDTKPTGQILRQWVAMIVEEKRVVTEW